MIVCHRKDNHGPYAFIQRERGVDDWSKIWSKEEFDYVRGLSKANYPVPAPMANGNMAMFVTYYVAALDWSGGQCDDD